MKKFYYDLKEYSKINNIDISNDSLFMYIDTSLRNNIKLKNYINYILFLDKSLEICDICSECYIKSIKIFDKNNNITVYNLINILRDIITYYSVMKRKHFQEEINEDVLNIEDTSENIYTKLIIEEYLHYLKDKDEYIEKCIRLHFLDGKSYRAISKEMKIGFRTVKNKIDKGLELIKKL